ncbi:Tyrosinase [Geodia barretti]|uniref:Tyrosinase n=1 Tax=Geodia barretti TaxID=519541 RepID=A0AA35SH85_GEOBA|nr:Tyrosinase [Geodia barretti]
MLFLVFYLAAVVAVVNAIIPLPCANVEDLRARECCPTPDYLGQNAGPCGSKLPESRGSCKAIEIPESEYNSSEKDVRKKWPIQYFKFTCVCNETFGGVDCGECSYAYNDNTTECTTKTLFPRLPVSEMSSNDWRVYHNALRSIKGSPARYMVATSPFSDDPQVVNDSLVQPTTYDLFVWLHHFVAKDNDITLNTDDFTDYAHEGTGFPTWHRLFLLWLEREIQIEISDHTFRLPYWDWTQPSQRESIFTRDKLGEHLNGEVVGDLFTNWETHCWEDITGKSYPIPICDPTVSSGETLRRCPCDTFCKKDNPNWPSEADVNDALAVKTYDDKPYDRYVPSRDNSFRNFMEGFVVNPDDCGSDPLCSIGKVNITRKLHNSVHILLGVGDVKDPPPFEYQGVMACVAASPNDPVFINHHANIDCILEKWLWENPNTPYPQCYKIRQGHRGNDYIVPFIPLYTHEDMFKTADNFGYECSTGSSYPLQLHAYNSIIIGMTAASVGLIMHVL